MSRAMSWVLMGSLTLLAAMLFAPAGVSAHADYERSEPAKDAVLPEQPARVDVWFTQEVFRQEGSNFVRVFNDIGEQVSQGDGVYDEDDRHHIFAELQTGLAEGRYIVEWMSTSDEDGDTDEGSFCFYVIVQPTAEQAAECAAFEDEAPEASPTAGAAATEPATEPVDEATRTAVPDVDAQDDDDGGNNGAIIAGIIGGIAVAVVVIGGAAMLLRRRS